MLEVGLELWYWKQVVGGGGQGGGQTPAIEPRVAKIVKLTGQVARVCVFDLDEVFFRDAVLGESPVAGGLTTVL